MSIEQFLLWVAIAGFLCGAATGVIAHMKWMDYSKCKDNRRVSIALSVCVAAYGVALASMAARLLLQGEVEQAVIGGIVVTVGAACLMALAMCSGRAQSR